METTSSSLLRSAQVGPIDIWAHIFARNLPAGLAIDVDGQSFAARLTVKRDVSDVSKRRSAPFGKSGAVAGWNRFNEIS